MLASRRNARAQRVAGLDVAPGRGAIVRIGPEDDPGASISGWFGVGREPGPRVSVLAALSGHEVSATLAARVLLKSIDLGALRGSVLVVPVCRPRDRLARPGQVLAPLAMPGDPGGKRLARLAFSLYSEAVVGAEQVFVLASPRPGRCSMLSAETALGDARSKRLALATGAQAVMEASMQPASLMAVAIGAQRMAVRLVGRGDDGDVEALAAAVRRAWREWGIHPLDWLGGSSTPMVLTDRTTVRAEADGVWEEIAVPGTYVRKGGTLGVHGGVLGTGSRKISSPIAGFVIQAPATRSLREGDRIFVLGRGPKPVASPPNPKKKSAAITNEKLRTGWLEAISLPDLGLNDLAAKIDTGARTSALHVASMRVVGRGAGPSRRPILELALSPPGGARKPLIARAAVKDYVEVRDTSGRIERRPVIETNLTLGTLRRYIRITLTNRGDMQCPMLVGRTALGGSVVVDPSGRYLLGRPKKKSKARKIQKVDRTRPPSKLKA